MIDPFGEALAKFFEKVSLGGGSSADEEEDGEVPAEEDVGFPPDPNAFTVP